MSTPTGIMPTTPPPPMQRSAAPNHAGLTSSRSLASGMCGTQVATKTPNTKKNTVTAQRAERSGAATGELRATKTTNSGPGTAAPYRGCSAMSGTWFQKDGSLPTEASLKALLSTTHEGENEAAWYFSSET